MKKYKINDEIKIWLVSYLALAIIFGIIFAGIIFCRLSRGDNLIIEGERHFANIEQLTFNPPGYQYPFLSWRKNEARVLIK